MPKYHNSWMLRLLLPYNFEIFETKRNPLEYKNNINFKMTIHFFILPDVSKEYVKSDFEI